MDTNEIKNTDDLIKIYISHHLNKNGKWITKLWDTYENALKYIRREKAHSYKDAKPTAYITEREILKHSIYDIPEVINYNENDVIYMYDYCLKKFKNFEEFKEFFKQKKCILITYQNFHASIYNYNRCNGETFEVSGMDDISSPGINRIQIKTTKGDIEHFIYVNEDKVCIDIIGKYFIDIKIYELAPMTIYEE